MLKGKSRLKDLFTPKKKSNHSYLKSRNIEKFSIPSQKEGGKNREQLIIKVNQEDEKTKRETIQAFRPDSLNALNDEIVKEYIDIEKVLFNNMLFQKNQYRPSTTQNHSTYFTKRKQPFDLMNSLKAGGPSPEKFDSEVYSEDNQNGGVSGPSINVDLFFDDRVTNRDIKTPIMAMQEQIDQYYTLNNSRKVRDNLNFKFQSETRNPNSSNLLSSFNNFQRAQSLTKVQRLNLDKNDLFKRSETSAKFKSPPTAATHYECSQSSFGKKRSKLLTNETISEVSLNLMSKFTKQQSISKQDSLTVKRIYRMAADNSSQTQTNDNKNSKILLNNCQTLTLKLNPTKRQEDDIDEESEDENHQQQQQVQQISSINTDRVQNACQLTVPKNPKHRLSRKVLMGDQDKNHNNNHNQDENKKKSRITQSLSNLHIYEDERIQSLLKIKNKIQSRRQIKLNNINTSQNKDFQLNNFYSQGISEMSIQKEQDQQQNKNEEEEDYEKNVEKNLNENLETGKNVLEQRPSRKLKKQFKRITMMKFFANNYNLKKHEIHIMKSQSKILQGFRSTTTFPKSQGQTNVWSSSTGNGGGGNFNQNGNLFRSSTNLNNYGNNNNNNINPNSTNFSTNNPFSSGINNNNVWGKSNTAVVNNSANGYRSFGNTNTNNNNNQGFNNQQQQQQSNQGGGMNFNGNNQQTPGWGNQNNNNNNNGLRQTTLSFGLNSNNQNQNRFVQTNTGQQNQNQWGNNNNTNVWGNQNNSIQNSGMRQNVSPTKNFNLNSNNTNSGQNLWNQPKPFGGFNTNPQQQANNFQQTPFGNSSSTFNQQPTLNLNISKPPVFGQSSSGFQTSFGNNSFAAGAQGNIFGRTNMSNTNNSSTYGLNTTPSFNTGFTGGVRPFGSSNSSSIGLQSTGASNFSLHGAQNQQQQQQQQALQQNIMNIIQRDLTIPDFSNPAYKEELEQMRQMLINFFYSSEFASYSQNDQLNQIQVSLNMFKTQVNKLLSDDYKNKIGGGRRDDGKKGFSMKYQLNINNPLKNQAVKALSQENQALFVQIAQELQAQKKILIEGKSLLENQEKSKKDRQNLLERARIKTNTAKQKAENTILEILKQQETTDNLDSIIQNQYETFEIVKSILSGKNYRGGDYSTFLQEALMNVPFDKCKDMAKYLKEKATLQASLVNQNQSIIRSKEPQDKEQQQLIIDKQEQDYGTSLNSGEQYYKYMESLEAIRLREKEMGFIFQEQTDQIGKMKDKIIEQVYEVQSKKPLNSTGTTFTHKEIREDFEQQKNKILENIIDSSGMYSILVKFPNRNQARRKINRQMSQKDIVRGFEDKLQLKEDLDFGLTEVGVRQRKREFQQDYDRILNGRDRDGDAIPRLIGQKRLIANDYSQERERYDYPKIYSARQRPSQPPAIYQTSQRAARNEYEAISPISNRRQANRSFIGHQATTTPLVGSQRLNITRDQQQQYKEDYVRNGTATTNGKNITPYKGEKKRTIMNNPLFR